MPTQIQGSHRLLEGGQGGMRAQSRSAVSYCHMLQQTCGGFFPAYSSWAYDLILLISVGNVMSRWVCPLNWYFRQKRLIYVYLIIGDAFLNLISFGWFPIYPHIHAKKKKDKKFFWLLYFLSISSMVHRGWWGGDWGFLQNTWELLKLTRQTPFETEISCVTLMKPVSCGTSLYLQRNPHLGYILLQPSHSLLCSRDELSGIFVMRLSVHL